MSMKAFDKISLQGYDIFVLSDRLYDLVLVLAVDLVGNAEVLELLEVGVGHYQRVFQAVFLDYSDLFGGQRRALLVVEVLSVLFVYFFYVFA